MKRNIASFFIVFLGILICLSLFLFNEKIVKAEELPKYKEIIVKYYNNKEINIIKVPENVDFDVFLNTYKLKKGVEFAEPNFTYKAAIIPSDTNYSNQWYLSKIKAPQAWDTVRESPDIIIAIIDSGVQIEHPDLKDNIWKNKKEIAGNGIDDDKNGFIDDVNGWDFVNNVNDPRPKFQDGYSSAGILHGTIVAGIAAASGNNAGGISGVTWRAQIMPLKVLDDKGEGDTNSVIKAIDYAIANGADILNFSFVGFGNSHALERAIRRAYEAGILIVAAAGNEQDEGNGYFLDEKPMYPACHDGNFGENMVIGVSATDALDQKANFSSYGNKCVDIAAPGVSIYSTSVYSPDASADGYVFNKYYDGYWSGTSMAAPMVSGALALIETIGPGYNRKEAIDFLLASSDNINRLNQDYLWQLGRGRLNVGQAVLNVKNRLVEKTARIMIAPNSSGTSTVDFFDKNGVYEFGIAAYGDNYRGGIYVASGDVDGDGVSEMISGTGFGGGPQVRIFDINGNVKGQFFAYDKNFRGGVHVAVADVDGDNVAEIITGAGFGGGPQVRIFDINGKVKGQFFAYDKNFRGGVNVAAGDVDGDSIAEIITGAGFGGGPHVRIFDKDGKVKGQFFAYDKNFRGGVNVAIGKIHGGARTNLIKIITAPGNGGGPHIKIFTAKGDTISQFFAYDKKFHGGVSLAVEDLDADGLDDIITGAGPGGTPHVRIFNDKGTLKYSFLAYEPGYSGGVNVGGIKY